MARSPGPVVEIITADTPLSSCSQVRLGLAVPFPISERIDDIVASAEEVGERTNRKEVIAALVLSTSIDGPAIGEAIRALRKARAIDALGLENSNGLEITPRERRPGPRPRH
jgi:hypothetical protein